MYPTRPAGLALIGAMLLAAPICQGQSARIILDSLFIVAHNHNPGLNALHIQSELLHLRPSQVATLADPELEVMWQALPLETASGPVRSQWYLRQRLPYFGAPALQRSIKREVAVASEASVAADVLSLNLEIKQALVDLYWVQQLELLLDRYEARLTGFVDAARAQYEVARGTQSALLRIQLEKNSLQSTRLQLNAATQTHELTLTRLLGIGASDLAAISEWPLPDPVRLSSDELMAVAMEHRPEFQVFASELRQSHLSVDLVRKGLWPAVAVGVTWLDIRSNALGLHGTDALGIRVSASIPFSRDQTRARIEEASLVGKEIATRKDAFLQALAADIATLSTQLSQYLAALELYDEGLIPQAEVVLNTTLSSYASGQAGFLDLLEAERTRYKLDVERINTAASLLRAAAELERTLGVPNLADLPRKS